MKLTLLSPTFPPDHCGVGDHSARLMAALEASGHQVTVLRTWSDLENSALSVDAVLVQYTPYLWSKSRIRLNPRMTLQMRRAHRRLGVPVILLAHEVHYPISWSLRGLLLGLGQKIQFLALAKYAHQIFFTYDTARKMFCEQRPALGKKASVLPVGSNIPVSSPRILVDDGKVLLIHFGGNHPTHCLPWTVLALEAAQAASVGKTIEMVWVGVDELEKKRVLKEMSRPGFSTSIKALGYLSANEVSEWLSRSTLVLAPFLDGISTRRGSVMAAFEHELPVVTNLGWASDSQISWKDFAFVSSSGDAGTEAENFVTAVVGALKNPEERKKRSAAGLDYYQKNFSWSKIADRVIQGLETSNG